MEHVWSDFRDCLFNPGVMIVFGAMMLMVLIGLVSAFMIWCARKRTDRALTEMDEAMGRKLGIVPAAEPARHPAPPPLPPRIGPPFFPRDYRPVMDARLDTFIVPADKGLHEESLFTDPTRFPDGRVKGPADTSMTQGGQLGYPFSFDVWGWGLKFDGEVRPETVHQVLAGLRLRFCVGIRDGNNPDFIVSTALGGEFCPILIIHDRTHFIEVSMARFHQKIDEMGPDKYDRLVAMLDTHLREFGRTGLWRCWARGMLDRVPFRIGSTTAFRVDALYMGAPLQEPATVRVMLRGRLFEGI